MVLVMFPSSSVNLLNCWATASTATTWHTTTWHTTFWHATSACCLVHLHHDGIDYTFELLLSRFELIFFCQLILIKPIKRLLHRCLDLLLVSTLELVFQFVIRQRVSHLEAIILQAILRLNLRLVLLILCPVLLCLLDHAVDLRLRQTTFFICNGDLVGLATGLVLRRDIKDAICVDIESDLDLGDATRGWRNTIQVELPQQVVIFRHRTLAFKHLDQYSWLVVSVRRECLPFLSWDSRVTLD